MNKIFILLKSHLLPILLKLAKWILFVLLCLTIARVIVTITDSIPWLSQYRWVELGVSTGAFLILLSENVAEKTSVRMIAFYIVLLVFLNMIYGSLEKKYFTHSSNYNGK
jgi:uncharacterized membrane protein